MATTAHSVDTLDVIAGSTTPRIVASIPLIITDTLDDATRGFGYVEQIDQTGSTAPFSFAVVAGALPLGLTLNADGSITGTPQVSGSFTFTVRLTDVNESVASATLTIRVFEPVQVLAGTPPGASVNQAYSSSLAAVGGFGPFVWTRSGRSAPDRRDAHTVRHAHRHADAVRVVHFHRDGDRLCVADQVGDRSVRAERHRVGELAKRQRRRGYGDADHRYRHWRRAVHVHDWQPAGARHVERRRTDLHVHARPQLHRSGQLYVRRDTGIVDISVCDRIDHGHADQ